MFVRILDPEKSTGSRIRIRNTACSPLRFCLSGTITPLLFCLSRELEREVNVGWTDIIPEPEADGSLLALMLFRSGLILIIYTSVTDLGPPGSGSISQRSGSFHHQAKIVRKTL
jgi:hypothetical protein